MLSSIKAILLTPLYHLVIAGSSRSCSRLNFFMAIFWLYILGQFLINIINLSLVSFLNSLGFPNAAAGYTHCRWMMILDVAKPPFQQHVVSFVESHATLLNVFYTCIGVISFVLALFICWRLLMLVIQRANSTGLSATALVCVTIVLGIAHYNNFPGSSRINHYSFFEYAFVAWLLFLAFFPPHEAVTYTPLRRNRVLQLVEKSWYHAFTAPLQGQVASSVFILALVLVYCIPVAFVWMVKCIVVMQLIADSNYPLIHVAEVMCTLGVMEHSQSVAAQGFRQGLTPYLFGIIQPLQSMTAIFFLFYPLSLLYIAVRAFMLLVQRFRHALYPHPVLWAVAAVSLIYSFNLLISYVSANTVYSFAVWGLILGIIAFLRPRKGISA